MKRALAGETDSFSSQSTRLAEQVQQVLQENHELREQQQKLAADIASMSSSLSAIGSGVNTLLQYQNDTRQKQEEVMREARSLKTHFKTALKSGTKGVFKFIAKFYGKIFYNFVYSPARDTFWSLFGPLWWLYGLVILVTGFSTLVVMYNHNPVVFQALWDYFKLFIDLNVELGKGIGNFISPTLFGNLASEVGGVMSSGGEAAKDAATDALLQTTSTITGQATEFLKQQVSSRFWFW
jgi:uncharacterized protein YoxC